MPDTVLTSAADAVGIITLNRPHRLNAINAELLSDFRTALDDALADPAIATVLLRGAGNAFCSGDDLKEFEKQSRTERETRRFVESIQDVSRRIMFGDKIVICCAHGWAVGGGLEWAINADISVFAESTRCFFPEIRWGMFPTGGVTAILPRIVGLAKARELMLFGKEFSAAEAHEMGLIWKVASDDAVFETAHEAAAAIARLPQNAARNLKRALNRQFDARHVELAMDFETQATIEGFLDEETRRRVDEFNR